MTIIFGALGLLIGSFLNVVAIRMLTGESIAFPPSHCAKCNRALKPWHLVPVVSYLFLRGRCRYCKERISLRYPVGELAAGLLFMIAYAVVGLQGELLVAIWFTCILIVITQTDLQSMRIPNAVVAAGVIGALPMRAWIHPLPLWDYLVAMFVGSGVLLLLGVVAGAILKREAMGGGDVKLYVLIGLVLGIKLTLLSLFAASVCGLVYSLGQRLAGARENNAVIPFGPFIALGALISYYYGDGMIVGYLGLFLRK